MTRVRIRGIYATALTELLRDAFVVVQPSDPIARRFEDDFAVADHGVAVETTEDRRGVGVVGAPEGVTAVRDRLQDVGLDALAWADGVPRGAVFDAAVVDALGSGAVVDLGPREGFLPYEAVEGYVDESDVVRVQVHEPAPPWADRRPGVDGTIRSFGGLADLVRGADRHRADVMDEEDASDLVRSVGMLPTDVPEGWAVRWGRAAAAADLDALDAALETAAERAADVERALEDAPDAPAGPPSTLYDPGGTAWVWFGRESRFSLDERRRDVTATMAGHHRIKAGGEAASAAVDFVERLCEPGGEFPFEAVADQFGPAAGDEIAISHGKPDGRRFSLGRGTVIERDGETVTVRRELSGGGDYDALGIPREEGDVATTKLREGRWWYPTVYRGVDGRTKGTYVNVCTPVEVFPDAATYLDLEVDVVRHADGTVERVDEDELAAAVDAGHVSPDLAEKAREVGTAVQRALS